MYLDAFGAVMFGCCCTDSEMPPLNSLYELYVPEGEVERRGTVEL